MYYQSKCAVSNDIFLLNIKKKLPPPKMIGLHVTNLDLEDSTTDSKYNWLRSSERIRRLSAAPDHIYLNTYGYKTKQDNIQLNSTNIYSSTIKKSQNINNIDQSRTIYDYIRQSIRLIEQQRKVRDEILSYRIQRPFNEDPRYRRTQREKRTSILPPLSHCSSSTTQTQSTISPFDSCSRENLMNYINHSRSFHSTQSSTISHDSNRK